DVGAGAQADLREPSATVEGDVAVDGVADGSAGITIPGDRAKGAGIDRLVDLEVGEHDVSGRLDEVVGDLPRDGSDLTAVGDRISDTLDKVPGVDGGDLGKVPDDVTGVVADLPSISVAPVPREISHIVDLSRVHDKVDRVQDKVDHVTETVDDVT